MFHREDIIYVSFSNKRSMISFLTAAKKMLAKDTAIFVPIAVPCVWKQFFRWIGKSFLSTSLRKGVGIEGLYRRNVSYVFNTYNGISLIWFLCFSNWLKNWVNKKLSDSFCWAVTAGYDWSPVWVWFVNLCKGMEFVTDWVLGTAIFLSFYRYTLVIMVECLHVNA